MKTKLIRTNDYVLEQSTRYFNRRYGDLLSAKRDAYEQYCARIGETILTKGRATHVILSKVGQKPIPVTPSGDTYQRYQMMPADYVIKAVTLGDDVEPLTIQLEWPELMVINGNNGFQRDGWLVRLNEIELATPSEVRRTYDDVEQTRSL